MSPIKVSVLITAYNHAEFITNTLEGVISQRVDFPFEIIVGEDDSTDGTREIVRNYGEKYPDLIQPLFNSREDVIYINGKPSGRYNFLNNLNYAKGEYIALLDGDDYWTNPNKLQKQVDYMDSHPDYSMCFHNVFSINEEGVKEEWAIPEKRSVYSKLDLLSGNFIPTCSVLFRRGSNKSIFPEWIKYIPMADWPLFIQLSDSGPIGYIDENMAVYRRHSNAIWSTKSVLGRLSNSIYAAELIRSELKGKERDKLDKTISNWKKDFQDVFHQNLIRSGQNTIVFIRKLVWDLILLHSFRKDCENMNSPISKIITRSIYKHFRR